MFPFNQSTPDSNRPHQGRRRAHEWMQMLATMALLLWMAPEGRAQSDVDSFNPGANGAVRAIGLQTDNKVLVGGDFTTLGGGGG
jgi:hypothetical protein